MVCLREAALSPSVFMRSPHAQLKTIVISYCCGGLWEPGSQRVQSQEAGGPSPEAGAPGPRAGHLPSEELSRKVLMGRSVLFLNEGQVSSC